MGGEHSKQRNHRCSRSPSKPRSRSRATFIISPSELPPFPPPSGYWILPAGTDDILTVPTAPPVPAAPRSIPTTSENRSDKGKNLLPVTSPASSFSSISSISTDPTSTSNSPGNEPDHGLTDLAISLLTELSMLGLDGPLEPRPKTAERGRIGFTEVTDGPMDTLAESTDHIRWEEWKLASEREMMERERRLLLRELELGLESYPKEKLRFGADGADDTSEDELTTEDEGCTAGTEDEECVSPGERRVWYSKVVGRNGWTGETRRWEYGGSGILHTRDFAIDDKALLDGAGSSRAEETGDRQTVGGLRRSMSVGNATLDVAETLTAEERETYGGSPSRARSAEGLAPRSGVRFFDAVERPEEGRASPRWRSSRSLRSSARARRVQSAEMLTPPIRSSSLGRTSVFSTRSSSVPALEYTQDEPQREDVLESILRVLERSDTHPLSLVEALGRTPTMRRSSIATLTPTANRSVQRPSLVIVTNPQSTQSRRASFSNTSSSIELSTPDALSFEPTTPSSASTTPRTPGTPIDGDGEYEVLMAQLRGTLAGLTGLFVRNGMGLVVTMVQVIFGAVGRSVRRLGLELHQLFGRSDPSSSDGRPEQGDDVD